MARLPRPIAEFLRSRRIAVAGVSRDRSRPANAIYRRLRDSGYEVLPVNPRASEVESVPCYSDVLSLPSPVDGVVIVTPPDVGVQLVRECSDRGIERVWFHRSLGSGSVSAEAVRECQARGIRAIVGGCPLMFCEPVDLGHKCMRWWFQMLGRVPK